MMDTTCTFVSQAIFCQEASINFELASGAMSILMLWALNVDNLWFLNLIAF